MYHHHLLLRNSFMLKSIFNKQPPLFRIINNHLRCLNWTTKSSTNSSIFINSIHNHQTKLSFCSSTENNDQTKTETKSFDSNLNRLKTISLLIVQRNTGPKEITQKQSDLAQELCNIYYDSNPLDRFRYLCFLSDEMATTVDVANQAATSFLQTQTRQEPFDPALLVDRLQKQIRCTYVDLFRYLSRLSCGVKFLVDLRSDLITVLSHPQLISELRPSSKVYLRILSTQLSDLLAMWFTAGFLHLERVTWDSPTSVLQKISEYEAVHPIKNWLDLKHRLGLYRRCYLYTHSCLEGEPLVILHVALVPAISSSIQDIIQHANFQHQDNLSYEARQQDILSSPQNQRDHNGSMISMTTIINGKPVKLHSFSRAPKLVPPTEDPNQVDAAVFYSISSTQKGLSGIDLGNQLIKQVAGGLKAEFPLMSRFSSLSPIPNFTEYLLTTIQAIQRGDDSKGFRQIWMRYADYNRLCGVLAVNDEHKFWSRMIQLLRSGNWITDQTLVESFKEPLMRICAHYLYHEKRRGYALNPVANFHMKNGAVMWRLNWLADISTRGLSNSCGIMVNYRYYLERYMDNSQIYMNDKQIITGEKFDQWIK